MENVNARAIALLSLALVLASAAPAAAAPDKPPAPAPDPDDPYGDLPAPKIREPQWKIEQRREILFREGQALAQQGHWEEALDKLRQVDQIRSHPKVLLWMGYPEEQLGHLLEAKAIYTKAKADAQAAKLKAEEQSAAQALDALTPKIPRLLVHLPRSEEAVVYLDTVRTPFQEQGWEVNPGKHVVSVSWPGRPTVETEVVAKVGEASTVEVALPEVPRPPAPPVPPAPPPVEVSRGTPGGAIALGITGVIALGVGVPVFFVGSRHPYNTTPGMAVTGGVLGVAGLGLLIGGLAWGISASGPPSEAVEKNAAGPRRAQLALQLSPSPGGLWAGVGGRF